MKTLKLDKNYKILVNNQNPYSDELGEMIETLVNAKKKGIINNEELKILLEYFISKETKCLIDSYFKSLFSSNKLKENLLIFDYCKKEHCHE